MRVTIVDHGHGLERVSFAPPTTSFNLFAAHPMAVQEVGMSRVDIARLHRHQILDQLVGRIERLLEEHDDDVVEFLFELRVPTEELFVQQLSEDAHQLVVDERDALQAGILEPLDLMLDDQLKGGGADKQGRRGAGRIVQDGPDVDVLDVVERIDGLDAVRIQLVEDEADASAARQLDARELLVVAFQRRPPLVAELGDDVEDDVGAVPQHRVAQLAQFGGVLLKRRRDASLDVGQGLLDVHHEDLMDGQRWSVG